MQGSRFGIDVAQGGLLGGASIDPDGMLVPAYRQSSKLNLSYK